VKYANWTNASEADMTPGEDLPITIRNQRYGAWSAILLLGVCVCLWLVVMSAVDYLASPFQRTPLQAIGMVFGIASLVVVLIRIDRLPPKRVKLSDVVAASSRTRFEPKNVRLFRIETDPYEDYAERELPIRLCQLTIEPHKGRAIKMIVSAGEARLARIWAEHQGIAVIDSNGHSMGDADKPCG
jgi:hypothetical protein